MQKLKILSAAEAGPSAKPSYDTMMQAFGFIPNIFGTMAQVPEVLEGTLKLHFALEKELPPKFRELAYVKASQLNQCAYCAHYHMIFGKNAGLSDEQLQAIPNFKDSPLFNAQEKAVLTFADQSTRKVRVDPDVLRELRTFLTEPQLIVLAASVGLAQWTNRINEIFQIELP